MKIEIVKKRIFTNWTEFVCVRSGAYEMAITQTMLIMQLIKQCNATEIWNFVDLRFASEPLL